MSKKRAALSTYTSQGAVLGVLAWAIYATIEFASLSLGPLVTQQDAMLTPSHWRASSAFFVAYPAFGAVVGSAVGFALGDTIGVDPEAEERLRALGYIE